MLLPLYTQVAHEFADLHDRTGRMKAKGVIRDDVDWANSRRYFYNRLRRRLKEDVIRREIHDADPSLSRQDITEELHRLMVRDCGADTSWEDDEAVCSWLEREESNLYTHADKLRRQRRMQDAEHLLSQLDPVAQKEVVHSVYGRLPLS